MTQPYQLTWVHASIYEQQSGFSRRTINRLIASGEWQQGVHYNYKRGKLMVNLKEADKWAASIDKSSVALAS